MGKPQDFRVGQDDENLFPELAELDIWIPRRQVSAMRGGRMLGATKWAAPVAAYALSFGLPCLAAYATYHVKWLMPVPFALELIGIAVVAWFGRIGPTALSVVVSVLLFNYFLDPPYFRWSPAPADLARTATLIVVGAFIGTVTAGLRRTQRAVEDRAAALAAAQSGSNSAAWVLDLRSKVTRWFPGGREIFGRPFAEFADWPSPMHLIDPEDHAAIEAAAQRSIQRGEEFRVEFRVRWPNGDLHWLEARGKADSANRNLFYGVTADITERKQAEAALVRAEKLAAVGQVASTMAHEINNPLAGIVNLLYLALADQTLSAATRGYLETAEEEIARLSAITRLTLSFARESHGEQTANLAEVVDSVLSLVKRKVEARGIRVEREIDADAVARIKAHELRQVLLNLTLNAIDAATGADDLIRIAAEVRGDRIAIWIEDNGCGIPEELADRIFDPFFSTKPEIGTGIGLWVSKELAQRNGGGITVASLRAGADARTRFEIQLPRE
jgi:PAS domain S-box-containing protein